MKEPRQFYTNRDYHSHFAADFHKERDDGGADQKEQLEKQSAQSQDLKEPIMSTPQILKKRSSKEYQKS